jgi:hypothetical protein
MDNEIFSPMFELESDDAINAIDLASLNLNATLMIAGDNHPYPDQMT